MIYLSEFREQHGWSWIEMQKQYLLNPQLFNGDLEGQLLAQTGVGGLNAAALLIATDRLNEIIDRLDKRL